MSNNNFNQLKSTIYEIVQFIKKDDYAEAVALMDKNGLTLNSIIENTFKLSQAELAKLTDSIIEYKIH